MGSEPHRIYLFGEFRLDANRRLLNRTNSGEVVELTPKALELLICLVQHAGTVLEKQTLLDSVWPHVIVEENNLTRAISALRSALGEEPKDHRYIATIPGRGYRFVANVAEVSGHGTDPQLQSRLKWKHGIVIAGMGLIVVMILLSEFFDTENPKTAVELKITRSMLLSASNGSD